MGYWDSLPPEKGEILGFKPPAKTWNCLFVHQGQCRSGILHQIELLWFLVVVIAIASGTVVSFAAGVTMYCFCLTRLFLDLF